MRDAEPRAIYLKDYAPPSYRIRATDLEFDIQDGVTEVRSRLRVERDASVEKGELVLDGEQLELVSLRVDGEMLGDNEYQRDDTSLTLSDLPAQCDVEIVTRICPESNFALEGLYKSGGMYCTQCEAQGFRRITYYQDRPDVLSVFTTAIIADRGGFPVLLSNGNPVADEDLGNGRRRVTWHDPFPKPCYLFALVAGDLALKSDTFTTASGRDVELRIYSEPHNIGQCDYAMDALKRAMRWDEEAFGREYDLDIFMIVAVEDFNMGAMENKGLNIFNTTCVLATPDTATDAAYQRVEGVVAHEYFHNWSGNRVTCRDWFQLSLKEGFTVFRDAAFSADMNSVGVKRIEDVRHLRAQQFAEDSGPLAHPVRPQSYIEISNFYTRTVYEKGAEVVRMLQTLLGPARFRQGTDLYFERHDGSAATTEDFLRAMAASSELDLDQFQRWYDQAGTPLLAVTTQWRNGEWRLSISQSCPPTPEQTDKQPFHIPVLLGLLDAKGQRLPSDTLRLTCNDPTEVRESDDSLLVHVRSATTTLVVHDLEEPPVPSFLRGFSAPVRVDFPRPIPELIFLAEHDSDGFARWDVLQTLLVAEIERLQTDTSVNAEIVALFGRLLDQAIAALEVSRIDAGTGATADTQFMLANLLALPEEGYLFEMSERVDVDALLDARDRLYESLAGGLATRWHVLYELSAPVGGYSTDGISMSRRTLRNTALTYLSRASNPDALEALLDAQYQLADNLTDRRAVLTEAASADVSQAFRDRLVNDFYERWQHEALVVNVWFSVQAAARHTDVEGIRRLQEHPAFDLRNPNKVRAVYGTFAEHNARNFHARDGAGYRLLAERVTTLDAANPQLASALAKSLTRWRRYDTHRQEMMVRALQTMTGSESLSKDLFEVISKSLPNAQEA